MQGMKRKQEFEKYHKGNWHSLATDPQAWLKSAEYLKEAADALHKQLWPAREEPYGHKSAAADLLYGPVYMLLAGLAIETLIKGIIVAKHPDFVKQQKLSGKLTHHNLPELYRTATLVTSQSGRLITSRSHDDLLLRLQNYVENFGRYPVTKTKQDMQKLTDTSFAGQTDPKKIDGLWDFLVKRIQPYIQ